MDRHIGADTAIDLHLHTTYSDGRWSAEQLLDHLTQEGFGLIAVTDHDRVDTVESHQQLGDEKHLTILAGVEISAAWHGKMADVLCYGFDPHDEGLRTIADRVRQGETGECGGGIRRTALLRLSVSAPRGGTQG